MEKRAKFHPLTSEPIFFAGFLKGKIFHMQTMHRIAAIHRTATINTIYINVPRWKVHEPGYQNKMASHGSHTHVRTRSHGADGIG